MVYNKGLIFDSIVLIYYNICEYTFNHAFYYNKMLCIFSDSKLWETQIMEKYV